MLLLQQNLQPYAVDATQDAARSVANNVAGSQDGSRSVVAYANGTQDSARSVGGLMTASGSQEGSRSVANHVTAEQSVARSVANNASATASGSRSVSNNISAVQAGSRSVSIYTDATQGGAVSVAEYAAGESDSARSISVYVDGLQGGSRSIGGEVATDSIPEITYASPAKRKSKAGKAIGGHYWKPEELAQIEPLVTKQPIAKLPAKEPEPITPKPRINRLDSVVSAHTALADIGIHYKQEPVDYSQVINALQIEIQRQKDDDDYAIATLMAMLL